MRRDDAYLLDILIAARKALRFTEDIAREGFEGNDLIQNAVLYSLEVIREAAARISKDFKQANKQIEWQQIVGLKNRVTHEYFRIDLDTIWDTVQNDLPRLIEQIEPLVPPEDKV